MYQTMGHVTTNATPSELFVRRHLRTHFDFLRKHLKEVVWTNQAERKQAFGRRTKYECFFPKSPVLVRDYLEENKWIPGMVLRKFGQVTYLTDVGKGQVWKRHLDQLRHRCGEIH